MYWRPMFLTPGINAPSAQQAMGGMPQNFKRDVVARLRAFQDANIHPVFVFPGTNPHNHAPFAATHPDRREAAWAVYSADPTSFEPFTNLGGVTEDILMTLFDILVDIRREAKLGHDLKPDVVVAPTTSCAQLAIMEELRQVDRVLADPEYLLYAPATPFVVLDIRSDTMTCVANGFAPTPAPNMSGAALRANLAKYGVTNPIRLVRLALLAGCDACPTAPALDSDFTFAKLLEKVKTTEEMDEKTWKLHIKDAVIGDDTHYWSLFTTGEKRILHAVVVDQSGSPTFLNPPKARTPLTPATVGHIVPDELYFLQLTGAIRASLIAPLIDGRLITPTPHVDSDKFRHLVEYCLKLREAGLGLLTALLHPAFRSAPMRALSCYEADQPLRMYPPATKTPGWWALVPSDQVYKFIRALGLTRKALGISLAARLFHRTYGEGSDFRAAADETVRRGMPDQRDYIEAFNDESLYLAVLLMGLEALGHVSLDTCFAKHSVTSILGAVSPVHEQAAWVLVETVKMGLDFSPVQLSHGVPHPITSPAADIVCWLVAMLDIPPPNAEWSGPLDPAAVATWACIAHLKRELHAMLEVQLALAVMQGMAKCAALQELTFSVARRLPFRHDSGAWLVTAVRGTLVGIEAGKPTKAFGEYFSASTARAVVDWVHAACGIIQEIALTGVKLSPTLVHEIPAVISLVDKLVE